MTTIGTGGAVRLRLLKQRLGVVVLAGLLLGLSAALSGAAAGPERHELLDWPLLAVLFGLAEACVLHVQVRREGQTISLSEVPLVLGLLFAGPEDLLVGRVAGALLGALLVRRVPLIKLTFNLAMQLAEVTLAAAVFAVVVGPATFPDPRSWAACLAAAAAAALLSGLSTSLVIAVYEGGLALRELLRESCTYPLVAALVAVFGLVAAYPLDRDPRSAVLLLVVCGSLLVAYRAYSSLSGRHLSLERLYRFSHAVSRTPEIDEILRNVLGQARDLLRAEHAEVVFLGASSDGQAVRLWLSPEGQLQRQALRSTAEAGAAVEDVLRRGQPLVLPRGGRDPRLAGRRDAVLVPLHGELGVVGSVTVADRSGDARTFDVGDVQLLETIANHAGTALENGRLIDRLRHESLHDALTGLPNRVLLGRRTQDELARLQEGTTPGLAVVLVDLDGFKEVNDTLGHQHGDVLLQRVAQRLVDAAGPEAVVARLGGDEFALLLPGEVDEEGALERGRALLAAVRRPVRVDDLTIEVGGSFGIALAPAHGRDASLLLKRADVAMYAAKAARAGVRLYDPQLDTSSPQRLALVRELREGLLGRQVVLYVQPKVRLADGVVVGVEALARWQHPEHGLLAPEHFIPLAERNDLIGPLTSAVLSGALAACAAWSAQGHRLGVAVNVSARSLRDGDLADEVAALLAAHRVPAELLTLEITEGSVLADLEATTALLDRLHAMGVRLSVDDFGTGYSSLSYLKRLPVQEVKIDRSFVTHLRSDADDRVIVRSIIDLGANLSLDVVAEGVEDGQAWEQLRALGCGYAQGYLVSRPLPLADFLPWLAAQRPASLVA